MWRIAVYVLAAVSTAVMCPTTVHADELSPELRQLVINAGMAPWSWRAIDLDDTLRGANREKVVLRQFIGKPVLAYNYAEW